MSVFSGLNKLKDALDDAIHENQKVTPAGHSKTQEEVRSDIHGEERKVHEIQKKTGWSDKIKGALDGDDEERRKQDELLRLKVEKEKAGVKERVKEERGLTGKMQDLVDHGESRKRQEEAEYARIDAEARQERSKQLGLRGKILDVLDGSDPRHAGSKPASENGLKDRVSELWGSGAKQNAERKEDIGDKILDVLAGDKGKKQKEKEAQKNWFANKINEMGGGGQAGELKEDKLDKAIDLFQQHILKQGDQSNESAIEQLKDEQIANAIRQSFKSVTGHTLPKGK
ncbi:hypothetical protein BJ322DRAFT_1047018 [Thelephora terrestris]|uniref:Uncharacterized protein n=1 Tax=Thelephora terrestris TaxID=56493 RepID=A0A9P6HKJ8_9AGAM|nr:hypothetical protein BJ322DRAFT_1047018 [Thelephora terrestris]